MRALSIAIAALVAGLGAASWFVFHGRGHSAHPKAPTSPAADVVPVAASPSLPPVLVLAQKTTKSSQAAPAASVIATKAALNQTSPQEAPYRDLFAADAPPVAESWKYQNAIRRELGKLPSSLVSVEAFDCRSRLCTARLLFDSAESDMKILKAVFLTGTTEDFPQGFGAIAAPTREYLPDGKVRTTLYLAREGEMVVVEDDSEATAGP